MEEAGKTARIIIVGGGTAGWMTANYLARFLARVGSEITLIESPRVATIGVGEATLPSLVRFVRNMGFDEQEFMRECNATYKLGIKFRDWIARGYSYWHPFGICGSFIDGQDLFHFWHKFNSGGQDRYSDYSLQASIADAGKAPCDKSGASAIIDAGAYAYHLDAAALARFLKAKAISAGVRYLHLNIDAVTAAHGNIRHVRTEDGVVHEADLYIDCSGFSRLLISEVSDAGFVDWSGYLLCDRAVVATRPVDNLTHANTCSTALGAGWCWQIPLGNRTGCGYVYSSAHTSDELATAEFISMIGSDPEPGTEPRYMPMQVGHGAEFWAGNCVAIGLSGGFVEPLESTGIHFIQQGIEALMDRFPDSEMNPVLQKDYNHLMIRSYEEIRDFILMHYLLSTRDDTPFWNDCRHTGIPATLQDLLDLYDESGKIIDRQVRVFPDTSYFHILSGGRRLPRRPMPMVDVSDPVMVRQILQRIRITNRQIVEALPLHPDYIRSLAANG